MESNIGIVKPNLSELTERVANRNNEPRPEVSEIANRVSVDEQGLNELVRQEAIRSEERGTLNSEQEEQLLTQAIETVSAFIEPQIRNVNFTQDDSTGQRVIRVFDAESDELIKQFPSEEILELAERIRGLQEEIVDKTGILIDDKV